MKFSAAIISLLISSGSSFMVSEISSSRRTSTSMTQQSPVVLSMSDQAGEERMRQMMKEESMNADAMKMSAEQMKNMKPEDLDKLISEVDSMDDVQKDQLKKMGMNPDVMKKSMEMMKNNPEIMKSAQRMMENMTPEQMAEQSRIAQEKMMKMSPEQIEEAAKTMSNLSDDQVKAAEDVVKNLGTASDPNVLDSMYRIGELMSSPPTGGVTLAGFATIPPISVLSGTRDEDLSADELQECWDEGSLGKDRVDRNGFERVWNEVRDYFEGDIMIEARKTSAKEFKSAGTQAATSSNLFTNRETSSFSSPTVGSNLNADQMNVVQNQIKNMSDDDMSNMLDQMSNMTPEQEERMKAMGVNPEMMKKSMDMMKNNPMMRKAAQTMMKNMSPEQMMKASQQAQEQMSKMSNSDYEKAMEEMKKNNQ